MAGAGRGPGGRARGSRLAVSRLTVSRLTGGPGWRGGVPAGGAGPGRGHAGGACAGPRRLGEVPRARVSFRRGGSAALGSGPAMAFRRRAKSHPLFSQEFLIHNHADIGFCLVLSVLIALMFEVRPPAAPPAQRSRDRLFVSPPLRSGRPKLWCPPHKRWFGSGGVQGAAPQRGDPVPLGVRGVPPHSFPLSLSSAKRRLPQKRKSQHSAGSWGGRHILLPHQPCPRWEGRAQRVLNPLFLHTPRRFWDGPCPAPLPEHPGVQGEVKPSLILPAVAKGGVCLLFPLFFSILAVFQVFSPQHRVTSTRGGSWASSGRQGLLGRSLSRSIPRCSLCSSPGKLRPAGPSQFRANRVGNAALSFSGFFSPACCFPFLVRGGDGAGWRPPAPPRSFAWARGHLGRIGPPSFPPHKPSPGAQCHVSKRIRMGKGRPGEEKLLLQQIAGGGNPVP